MNYGSTSEMVQYCNEELSSVQEIGQDLENYESIQYMKKFGNQTKILKKKTYLRSKEGTVELLKAVNLMMHCEEQKTFSRTNKKIFDFF